MRNVTEVASSKLLLAFETSCDDTSIALVRGRPNSHIPDLISMAVQTQFEVHSRFGGVVPELASRAHLENLLPCMRKVLSEAKVSLSEIDAFAATAEPGLVGCLLIGHTAAKTLALLYDRALISCDHLEGHLHSIYLEHRPEFPYLAAVVSGGHSSLYLVRSFTDRKRLGGTLDDAIGEAFDKGGKLLKLGFPGGPEIDRLAKTGDPMRYAFGKVNVQNYDFSFSGLKSEFARLVIREGEAISGADAAASYQKALILHLEEKIVKAVREFQISRLVIVGGVARNSFLRDRLSRLPIEYFAPRPEYCTDNAAMIGILAYQKWQRNEISDLTADVRSTSRLRPRKLAPC